MRECTVHPIGDPRMGLCRTCWRAYYRYIVNSAEPDVLRWTARRAYAAGHRKGRTAGVRYQRRKTQVFRKTCHRSAKFDKPKRKTHPRFDRKKRRVR